MVEGTPGRRTPGRRARVWPDPDLRDEPWGDGGDGGDGGAGDAGAAPGPAPGPTPEWLRPERDRPPPGGLLPSVADLVRIGTDHAPSLVAEGPDRVLGPWAIDAPPGGAAGRHRAGRVPRPRGRRHHARRSRAARVVRAGGGGPAGGPVGAARAVGGRALWGRPGAGDPAPADGVRRARGARGVGAGAGGRRRGGPGVRADRPPRSRAGRWWPGWRSRPRRRGRCRPRRGGSPRDDHPPPRVRCAPEATRCCAGSWSASGPRRGRSVRRRLDVRPRVRRDDRGPPPLRRQGAAGRGHHPRARLRHRAPHAAPGAPRGPRARGGPRPGHVAAAPGAPGPRAARGAGPGDPRGGRLPELAAAGDRVRRRVVAVQRAAPLHRPRRRPRGVVGGAPVDPRRRILRDGLLPAGPHVVRARIRTGATSTATSPTRARAR
jgi:hypothetical protein